MVEKINEFLDQQGVSCSEVDYSLFYIKDVVEIIILILYVDDLLLTS